MPTWDALVVGAGPAGSVVAERLSRSGRSVLMVEEHGRIGHPVQCAGLVSKRVLALAGSESYVLRPVRGATVWSPGGVPLRFSAADDRAYVIDRAGLDVALADAAARAGAEIRTGVKFDRLLGLSPAAAKVRLVDTAGSESEVEARLVIGADGVSSSVARAFRLRRPVEILPAFEAEIPNVPGDPEQVEVYLGNEISPGLFGWSIPDGSGGARIGVAVHAGAVTAREYYRRLVAHIERFRSVTLGSPTGYLVSGIPIGTVPRTSASRVLLVGDAAAQVKPVSGGGIYTGMRCAEIAARTADSALASNDLSAAALEPYDAAWRAEFGEEFRRALYLRRVLVRLSDRDLEELVRALQSSDLKASIVAFGDIDFPSHVARRLFRQSPSLLRLFPKALGALWGSPARSAPDLEPGPRRQAR